MLENEMEKRTATCRCGQLKVTCEGEPVRRSGSAFAAQARWPEARIMLTGRSKAWERVADSGHKATYQFCLIAARRSHTSSKAGPAWSQCPSAHLRTPPSPPQNSPSTSTVSTRGSWYWAKPWSIPLRQVSCAILARRSPHHTPDDRGQAIGGLRFQAEQRRPAHETDGRGRRPILGAQPLGDRS